VEQPDVSLGERIQRNNDVIRDAEKRHADLAAHVYGDGGHKDSDQRARAEEDARRQRQKRELLRDQNGKYDPIGEKLGKFDHIEKSEAFYERIRRMIDSPNGGDIEHLEPDRQREALDAVLCSRFFSRVNRITSQNILLRVGYGSCPVHYSTKADAGSTS
jgi:hypothetical protein